MAAVALGMRSTPLWGRGACSKGRLRHHQSGLQERLQQHQLDEDLQGGSEMGPQPRSLHPMVLPPTHTALCSGC
jgi:hypothetical protein